MAKGVLYAVVALIAIEVARGDKRKTQDEEGAITALADQPFAELLLVLLAIGLAGYTLWRLRIAILGPPGESGASALVERGGSVALAVAYGGLFVYTVRFLATDPGGGTTEPDTVTKRLLDEPYGVALGHRIPGTGAALGRGRGAADLRVLLPDRSPVPQALGLAYGSLVPPAGEARPGVSAIPFILPEAGIDAFGLKFGPSVGRFNQCQESRRGQQSAKSRHIRWLSLRLSGRRWRSNTTSRSRRARTTRSWGQRSSPPLWRTS
ncbi:MAG: DUF1206 domain-containing protein [Solirubrobacterales bacterium]